MFNKVYKKEIKKYQKAKDYILDILNEYLQLKILLGKSFNKDSFKKVNERLDNLEKEQLEKLIKNYEDYMKPSIIDHQ